MDFTGKHLLITGASRGIGKACAVSFAGHGATIAVHYNRNQQGAHDTIQTLPGEGHMSVQADISHPTQVKAMVDKVIAQFGKIDIVVNNAGIYIEHPIAETSYETWQIQWHDIIQTNLIGSANVAYCVSQHMIATGGGRIVNVTSRGAFRGEPTAPAYGASKAGMNAMSQSLAKALAPHNIFVMAVAPGWVETDMARRGLERSDSILNQSPLGRIAKPEEVAYAVMFCAAEGSAFSTGTIIDVNGASYLRT